MKREKLFRSAAAFCMIPALLLPVTASANSGPAHWENSPSFSMTALEDCPVTVEGENLTFNFQKAEKDTGYSPETQVTAEYQMKNPTGKPLTVQMAFPLIASLNNLAQMDGVQISVDGKPLKFEIYLGGKKPKTGYYRNYYTEDGKLVKDQLPTFAQILQSVHPELRSAFPVMERLKGTGKRYALSYTDSDNANLNISFHTEGKKAAFLTSGFNGYSCDEKHVELSGWVGKDNNKPVSVLAFGAQPELDGVKAYGDGSASRAATGKSSVSISEQDAKSYFREQIKKSGVYRAYPSEDFLNRMVAAAEENAEASIVGGNPVFGDAELNGFYELQRMLVLAYQVEFPANGAVAVTVSYPMSGAMETEKTVSPVYSYGYLLNPAKGWADFKNLNLRVITPKKAPYLVKSSIPLEPSVNSFYYANLDSLPNVDFTFSLCAQKTDEPVSPMQKISSEENSDAAPVSARKIGTVLVIVVVLLAALLLYARFSRRKTL